MNKNVIILLVLAFSVNSIYAQLPANIQFTNYNKAQGLPEEQTTSIVQDSRGFFWIGSIEGLFRFDGKNFKSWYANANDSSTFKSNSITVIDEYLLGKILFFSYNSLWQIDISTHKIEPIKSFINNTITFAPVKINNNLWQLSTLDSIFFTNAKFEKLYGYKVSDYFNANATVTGLKLHYPYILLSAANYDKYYFYNYVTKQLKPFNVIYELLDPRSNVLSLRAYDSTTKRLYMSNWFNGFFYIDIDANNTINYKPIKIDALNVHASRTALLTHNNLMLTAGDEGFVISDFKTKQTYTDTTVMDKPIANGAVRNIYKAKNNTYWLNTIGGISSFSFKPNNIQYYKNEFQLKQDDEIKSIIKANDGNVYILFARQGLYKINPTTNQVCNTTVGIGYWWGAISYKDNIILYGGSNKLYNYNYKKNKLFTNTDIKKFYPPNNDLVTKVHSCKNGDIWYSINVGGGLVRFNASNNTYKAYTNTSNPPTIPIRYATAAAEDSKGNIWFATNKNNLIIRWNAGLEKFDEYKTGELLPSCKINSSVDYLYVDLEDNLWIALGASGVIKYNPTTKQGDFLDLSRGMPTVFVNSIVADNKNRIWMGSAKGLICYIPTTSKVVAFTTTDGLPEDELVGTGILYNNDENKLYVGGKKSVATFCPDSLLQNIIIAKPTVYIEDMQVNGKIFYYDSEKNILLQPNENNLSFNFAVPDFERNNQLEFEYNLAGNSANWVSLGDKRSVIFNSLSSGNYTLTVRCKYIGAEQWFETPNPFSFTIKTPWYKTWWFMLCVIAISALLLWYVVRQFYLNKLEKQKSIFEKQQAIELERTRIATDMHDDFGASLSRIKFISEKMQLQKSTDEKTSTDLSKISTYSDEMAQKMNEIVWALNQRYDSLEDLINFCRAYAAEFLQDKNITLHFENKIADTHINIKGEVRRNIYLIVKESIHNIYKHAQAKNVHVHFIKNEHKLQVIIKDDGRGIDFDAIRPFSNGLQNMKKRAEEMGGSILIENENGTKSTLSIPIMPLNYK